MKRILALLIPFITFFSCNNSDTGSSSSLLPAARGEEGEIILVIDNDLWNTSLGKEINAIFGSKSIGLPRPQSKFDLRQVHPTKLNNLLKGAKNMIFVTTLDGRSKTTHFYTEASLKQIEERPDLFMEADTDRYAKGQNVLYLFNPTVEGLVQKLRENKLLLEQHFNTIEKDRFISRLKKGGINKGVRKRLNSQQNVDMLVPVGYDVAIEEEDFLWIRQMSNDSDKSIFITSQPYTSESIFDKDSVIAWRNRTARQHIFADPEDTATYVTTERTYANVTTKKVSFNGDFCIETRGLWKTNKAAMGGPFLSYTFYNDKNKRLYYIEGFVFSPGEPQREFMRELEALLWTFQPAPQEG